MKAIILAAGKGSRISTKIGNIPKSTLEIDGKPMIRNTVEALMSFGIEPIICVGYEKEKIQKALQGIDLKYYVNPFFDVTNNAASLWFCKEELYEETIILSADVVFQKEILQPLIDEKGDLILLTDRTRTNDGDYFFQLSESGAILKYGPKLMPWERSCEYVGIAKIGRRMVFAFKKRLEEFIDKGEHQIYFEQVFFSFLEESEVTVKALDVEGLDWREIDYYEDYEKVLKHFF